ncbi:MAG TPA: hypothetical protein PK668_15080 [Myxococcota bacterium]|nr:hypothetical protein [Myxococcota bacterium]HRY94217.1 hypothetical protein [Myxococcota bacterium]HSA23623.1 hypothetical protein [Myxococcota bacterium]
MRPAIAAWRSAAWLLLLAGLACSACGGGEDTTDGGDGEDAVDAGLPPCEAAAPLWREIWGLEAMATGLQGRTPQINLMDTWGTGPTDVYAVGFAGTILHYDGSAWTPMVSGSVEDLYGVWGYVLRDATTGAVTRTDVFAVGSNGTILRYNGETWLPTVVVNDPDPANPNPQAVQGNFHDVWGIAAPGPDVIQHHPVVVAVGSEGMIVRWNGTLARFEEMRRDEVFTWTDDTGTHTRVSWVRFSPERLGGVFGGGDRADPLFVAVGNNGTILELGGNAWSRVTGFTPPGVMTTHLNGIWGRSTSEMFAVGLDGMVLRRDGGGAWHVLKKENPDLWSMEPVYLRGTWAFGQSYCGELPTLEDGGVDPQGVRQNTSWALFVGWNGTLYLGHDGLLCPFGTDTTVRLEGIWGTPPRSEGDRWVDGGVQDGGIECDPVEVYIPGVNGTLLRLSNPEGR